MRLWKAASSRTVTVGFLRRSGLALAGSRTRQSDSVEMRQVEPLEARVGVLTNRRHRNGPMGAPPLSVYDAIGGRQSRIHLTTSANLVRGESLSTVVGGAWSG
jgi:hypothetical protein